MEEDSRQNQVRNLLIMAAGAVVVIAGIKAAAEILLPVMFAVFLSIIAGSAVRGLVRIHVPRFLAVLLVMLVAGVALVGGSAAIGNSLARFTAKWPTYQAPMVAMLKGYLAELDKYGVEAPELVDILNPGALVALMGQTVGALVSTLSRVGLILLFTAFILLEMVQIEGKFKAAFAGHLEVSQSLVQGVESVQRYLAIKTAASAVTGSIIGLATALVGLDFAILWGVLAFALNYIPGLGAIVAAIPALLLALLQLGPWRTLGLGVVYLGVHFIIGNFIEPRVLGRRLGLSPFVVLLSLFFWGWVWGPAGMLLSVPMTVVVKLLLEISPETRWLAIMLGGPRETSEYREQTQD